MSYKIPLLQKKYAGRLLVFGSINLGNSRSPKFFADLPQEMETQKRLGAHGGAHEIGLGASLIIGKQLHAKA